MVQDHHSAQTAAEMTVRFYCHYPPVSFCHHPLVCVRLPCFSLCPSIICYLRYELCLLIRFLEAFGTKMVKQKW